VATTGEVIDIPDVYEDPRFNASIDKVTGYRTKSLLIIPVPDQKGQTIAVTQLINSLNEDSFTQSDIELTKAMSVFTGIALANSSVIEGSIRATLRVQALLQTAVLLMQGGHYPHCSTT
jgi:GAF domain-containing protein